MIVYTESRRANSQPRSIDTSCPDLLGEPRTANSQRRLRDAARSPRAPFANGRPFTQSTCFCCLRFQLSTGGVSIPASIFRSRFGTPDSTLDTKSFRFCALASVCAKSFRIRSYERSACNSFRIRSYKIPRGVEGAFAFSLRDSVLSASQRYPYLFFVFLLTAARPRPFFYFQLSTVDFPHHNAKILSTPL